MHAARRILALRLVAAGCAVPKALPTTALRPGVSASGLVYFPSGDHRELEVVLVGEKEVVRVLVPVAPPPAEEE